MGNLLDNAFKFTRHNIEVSLNAYAAGDRILIDVEDNCGGLPAGEAEKMLLQSTQSGADESGRGLSICRRSVQANNGVLSVRDVPGSGCFQLPTFSVAIKYPSSISVRRDIPRQITMLPGGGSLARFR